MTGDQSVRVSGWEEWWRERGGAELRRLLREEWDPIGVADYPDALDEYDSYVGPLASRLRDGASEDDVYEYLTSVRRKTMELFSDQNADRATARRIDGWYRASRGVRT